MRIEKTNKQVLRILEENKTLKAEVAYLRRQLAAIRRAAEKAEGGFGRM